MARHEFWSCDRCDHKIVDRVGLHRIYVDTAPEEDESTRLQGEFCQRCQMVVLAAIDALLKEKAT